jgi:tetratricopeptide (TPR) repeat protein
MQKQKQYVSAIHMYEQADLLQPDNIWTVKHLAQCYKLSDNLEKALDYYRKVEDVQPDNLDIALQIGQVLVRMENYKEALSYFYKVEYLEKNPVNAQRAIAWCSFLTGKDEEALKYYHIILENPSCTGQDWMNTGHVYFAMHNIREAVRHYLKAQEYEKNHTNFLHVFYKDKEALLSRGLSEEDIRIVLDLLV